MMIFHGAQGPDVQKIQAVLRSKMYLRSVYTDGLFDDATEIAVKTFQNDAGISVDGVVGPITWATLFPAASGKDPYLQQNEDLALAALKYALQYVGQKEATGHNDGIFPNMLQRWYAGPAELGAPWCALFATWCNWNAAFDIGITPKMPKSDSSTNLFAWAQRLGVVLAKPIPHCIALQRGDGGTPGKTHHHTSRVIAVNEASGTFHAIDGNWGNQVSITDHRIKDFDFVAVI